MASLKFCPQSLEIPRMNRGMTVRGGMTISSSSRCLLAAKGYREGVLRMNRGMTVNYSAAV
ncbi:hypothetical protein [Wolbachia endosymbiont (group A) of Volucella inflata]|uniref:hypothetical protein n=1 Tax=Wolbachia endosymbiont (group A) of Volucella inflata TaxID=2954065 RepID=UPI002226F160|nr:hypothetical protein [Wolbachia endosymbiont (group A) of Volucella inflata]